MIRRYMASVVVCDGCGRDVDDMGGESIAYPSAAEAREAWEANDYGPLGSPRRGDLCWDCHEAREAERGGSPNEGA